MCIGASPHRLGWSGAVATSWMEGCPTRTRGWRSTRPRQSFRVPRKLIDRRQVSCSTRSVCATVVSLSLNVSFITCLQGLCPLRRGRDGQDLLPQPQENRPGANLPPEPHTDSRARRWQAPARDLCRPSFTSGVCRDIEPSTSFCRSCSGALTSLDLYPCQLQPHDPAVSTPCTKFPNLSLEPEAHHRSSVRASPTRSSKR